MQHHPLDPLDPEELSIASKIVRKHLDCERILFEQVRLLEPPKEVVRAHEPDMPVVRRAFSVVLDRDSGKIFELVVNLGNRAVESSGVVHGVQCCILGQECIELSEAIKQDTAFIEALAKRGITDINQVSIEMYAMANFANPGEAHLRLSKAHCFYVENPGDNPHVRPIEGLSPVVDLNTMEVLRIEDFGVSKMPPDRGEYRSGKLDTVRKPLAKLNIVQPEGPDYCVNGHQVTWQNWHFRVGFTPKEGLVLHMLSFRDGDTERSVIYRASLSELVVPYGDSVGDHYMNHSFDLGEGVFGTAVNSLTLGCDCVGEIYYFDIDLVDNQGNVDHRPNAICMHEEDYGILWKHTDLLTGDTEVRRSRRLVVSSFFTIGNYDYGLFWYLYLDGSIQFEAKLTGMLYTRAISDESDITYGTLVAQNLNAMIHEHYFNIRLDMSVDGDTNTVVEVEANRIVDPDENPHGNVHGTTETMVTSEKEAARNINPGDGRYWKIINPNRTNSLGTSTGYKLIPGPNIRPMHQPGSPFMRRAGFVEHDLWITAYDPKQLHAPGEYVNQGENGPGLPQWVKEDRPLENTDIVLWHTIGLMHVPRPEDYPVMPVETVGFILKPVGFFDRNPSLDLAPP
jgi:primary-amine oxidase